MDEIGKEEETVLNKVKENPFFPESRKLLDEEFEEMSGSVKFDFVFNRGDVNEWTAQIRIRGGQKQISMKLPFDVREKIAVDKQEMFRIEDEGKHIIYPAGLDFEEKGFGLTETDSGYRIDGLEPKTIEMNKNDINKVDTRELAKLLSEASGEEVVFYTGAGISMDGEQAVWGMDQLQAELKINEVGDEFSEAFKTSNKNKLEEILEKVGEFGNQLFNDSSTRAHRALAEVVEILPGSIVFTENVDLKHEGEGSRLKVVHTASDSEAFTAVKLRTDRAKFLITVGLSKDDRAVIQYLKKNNPDVRVVAMTLSEDTPPDYLDENDMVLLGDVQTTLPELVEIMKKK